MFKLTVVGGGAFGTAIGNILASTGNTVVLFSRNAGIVQEVNTKRTNSKFYPNIVLNPLLRATSDTSEVLNSDFIFFALPSGAAVDFVQQYSSKTKATAVIVNLAKGILHGGQTIVEYFSSHFSNQICTLKGPIFAAEAIHNLPAGMTLGSSNRTHFLLLKQIFSGTNICFDFTDDVRGVELLSILKNIYAIAVGIVDASYNSANARFLVLTKSFNEMKNIVCYFGGSKETLFKYCGFGDFNLTALNDLSRNRTLGLLIGKRFYVAQMTSSVVLEGIHAIRTIYTLLKTQHADIPYPILTTLHNFFEENIDHTLLVKSFLQE